jgi:hypothetical protein
MTNYPIQKKIFRSLFTHCSSLYMFFFHGRGQFARIDHVHSDLLNFRTAINEALQYAVRIMYRNREERFECQPWWWVQLPNRFRFRFAFRTRHVFPSKRKNPSLGLMKKNRKARALRRIFSFSFQQEFETCRERIVDLCFQSWIVPFIFSLSV